MGNCQIPNGWNGLLSINILCVEFGSQFPFRSSFGFFIVCVHLHIQGSKVTRFHFTILVGLVSDPIQDNTSLPFDTLPQPKPIIVPC